MSIAVLFLLGGCMADLEPWRLVFEDDFDGPEGSAPDPDVWTYDVGGDGWGNEQLEFNTDRPENVDLDGNGFLRIRARREAYEGNTWTSGRIKTEGLQQFEYGRIEARVLVPEGRGLWPAFWMLGADFADIGWPSCGEIDILELRGETPTEVLGTIHGPGYSGAASIGHTWTSPEPLSDDFHVYAVEWDPRHIQWWVDDTLVGAVHPGDLPPDTTWVLDHEFFLLLNLAVGGTFLEEPDDTTPDKAALGVDYVRVYERTVPLADPLDPE
jgi:beta-glucanase (GH16 family)